MGRIPPIRAQTAPQPPSPPDPAVAEMRALRAQMAAAEQREQVARRNRRGNVQGVGCLLVLGAVATFAAGAPFVGLLAGPLGVLLLVAGIVVFLIGLCL